MSEGSFKVRLYLISNDYYYYFYKIYLTIFYQTFAFSHILTHLYHLKSSHICILPCPHTFFCILLCPHTSASSHVLTYLYPSTIRSLRPSNICILPCSHISVSIHDLIYLYPSMFSYICILLPQGPDHTLREGGAVEMEEAGAYRDAGDALRLF